MKLELSWKHTALLALAAGLGTALGHEIVAPVELPQLPAVELQAKPQIAPSPQFSPPTAQEFVGIDERFVLSPFRKQYKVPPVAPPPPPLPPPPNIALVGIVIDGQTRLAIVKLPGASTASSLTVGEMIAGWQVTRIESDHLALQAGTAEQEFRLQNRSTPR